MSRRLNLVRALCREHGADAVLISRLPDIRWAVGFTGSNGLLLVRHDEAHFITDGRYLSQAREEVRDARVHIPGYALVRHIREAGLLEDARRVAFQSDHLTVAQLDELGQELPEVEWVPVRDLLSAAVASKEEWEVDRIRDALALTEQVFREILPLIRPGITEREVMAEIVYRHLRQGAGEMSFEPIVASGPRSALPHARSTDRAVRPGEVVLLDFGGVRDGFAADMTRVVALGEPGEEVRRVYQVVLDAQEAALERARSGMTSRDLDAAARDVLNRAGYGSHFTHSLGHGLGLQVHEWPRISQQSEYPLPENAVVTIEPGVYIPGRFGVRIEDVIRLRAGGADRLTSLPRELVVV